MNDAKSIIDPMLELVQENDVQIEMYFIKKTNSRKPEKMNTVLSARISGDVRRRFIKNIAMQINNIKNQPGLEFKNFFAEDLLPEDMAVIEGLALIPTFRHIEMQMEQHTNLQQIITLKRDSIEGLHSYAIEFKNINNKLIYFRKYTEGNVISSKSGLLSLTNGIFNSLEGDVCKFDDDIDCIYYKIDNINEIMYIPNRTGFESIFHVLDIYKTESRKVFEKLSSSENVEIPKYLIDQIQDKPAFLKKIAHISAHSGFDKIDINRISKIKTRSPALRFEVKNNKIVISNKDSFKDFLDVCENNILGDLIDDQKIFRTRFKEPLKLP